MKNVLTTLILVPILAFLGNCSTGNSGTGLSDPNPPTLTAGDCQLMVQWSSALGATGYDVYYSETDSTTNPAPIKDNTSTITETNHTITGLTNGTTYYVWIKANKKELAESDYSFPSVNKTLDYAVTYMGPGGGTIFYDDDIGYDFDNDKMIEAGEKDLMDDIGMRFLEAAPAGWNNSTSDPYAQFGYNTTDIPNVTNLNSKSAPHLAGSVGDGAQFTNEIVSYINNSESGRAAQLAQACSEGTLNDWFLPTAGELVILYSQKNSVGGISSSDYYWSSSEIANVISWSVYMTAGTVLSHDKGNSRRVRPIRAFAP